MSPRPKFSLSRLLSPGATNHAGPRKPREALKSLPIVVLLTALIWVYAENAQTRTEDASASLVFTVPDDKLTATIVNSSENVTITLNGPRGQIDVFKNILASKPNEGQLKLALDNSTIGEHTVELARALKNDTRFQSISVDLKTTPSQLTVMVDRVIDHEFPIELPSSMSVALKNVNFEPARVIVRGPAPAIKTLIANGTPVTVDVTGLDTTATTEPRKVTVSLATPSDSRLKLKISRVAMSFEVGSVIQSVWVRRVFVDIRRPANQDGQSRVIISRGAVIPNVEIRGPANLVDQYSGDQPQKTMRAVVSVTEDDAGKSGVIREVNFPDLEPGIEVLNGPHNVTFDVRDIGTNDR